MIGIGLTLLRCYFTCDTVFEYHGIALNIIPVDKKEL